MPATKLKISKSNMNSKRRKKREKKNWMPAEEMALINFLKVNLEFEKPTVQTYYSLFIQNSGVNADWKVARTKVLSLRTTYNKTKEWFRTVGVALVDEEAVENAIRSKCPFFYDLKEIFESNQFNSSSQSDIVRLTSIDETFNGISIPIFKIENNLIENINANIPNISQERNLYMYENLSSHANAKHQHIDDIPVNLPTTNCSKSCFHSTVAEVLQNQAEILKLKKEKMDFETFLKDKDLQLLEKQIAARKKELDFKESNLNNYEISKMLEFETIERIAMKELELKYNN